MGKVVTNREVSNVSANLFGKELRRLRREAGLNLVDLADAAGCSVVYVSQIERGEKAPPAAEQIRAMAKKLGCLAQLPSLLWLADRSRRAIEIGLKGKSDKQADMLIALKRKVDAGEIDDELANRIRTLLDGQGEHP